MKNARLSTKYTVFGVSVLNLWFYRNQLSQTLISFTSD